MEAAMSSPLVSVVLPVYNGERYLRSAVESILGQTLRAFEFLLMDDGSRDSSLAILHEYGRLDTRIRVVATGHRGEAATLNHGLRLAQADLVAKMDADDISLPERLGAQYERFASEPDLWVLGTTVEEIDDQGRVIGKPRAEPDPDKNSRDLLRWSPV
jgi:glycosyltransferase involved in cell wall biosynthesis